MSAALRGAGRATAPLLVAVLAAVGMAGCQLLRPAFAPQPRVPVRTGAVAPAALAVILDSAAARARADLVRIVTGTVRPGERLIVLDEDSGRLLGSFAAPSGYEMPGPRLPATLPRDPTTFQRASRRAAVGHYNAIVRHDLTVLERRLREALSAWATQSADAVLAAAQRGPSGNGGPGGLADAIANAVTDIAALQQHRAHLATRKVLAIIGLDGPTAAPPQMHASLSGLTVVVADGPEEEDQAAWQAMLIEDGVRRAFVITEAENGLLGGILSSGLDGHPAVVVTLRRIWYRSGQYRLPPAARPPLRKLLRLLAITYPRATASINAYTDSRPIRGGNLALSWRRARLILSWLVSHGIASSRLQAVGHGAADPVAPNHPWGQLRNRRVVVIVTPAAPGELGR